MGENSRSATRLLWVVMACGAIGACQPKIAVELPREPITINLNIKLDAVVRVKLEEQAKQDIDANPDLF